MDTIPELLKVLGPIGLLIEFVRILGLPALIFCVWYFDRRSMEAVLKQYGEDMQEMRRMYRSNVRLVEHYEKLATDLKDVIIMNTTASTLLEARLGGKLK